MLPAAADEVSAGIAHLLSGYGQEYQAMAGQAAAFHEQFVQHVTAGAGAYASAEAVNVALLEPLTAVIRASGLQGLYTSVNALLIQSLDAFAAFVNSSPLFFPLEIPFLIIGAALILGFLALIAFAVLGGLALNALGITPQILFSALGAVA